MRGHVPKSTRVNTLVMSKAGDTVVETSGPLASVDLHCHLLPEWDDGSTDFEESVKMVERALAVGMDTIAVTPHVGRPLRGIREKPAPSIPEATANLEAQLHERGLKITLVPG